MVEGIQDHIGSLNWGYRVALRDKNVKYINALATLEDAHTIKVRREGGERESISEVCEIKKKIVYGSAVEYRIAGNFHGV
jgi:pyruvate/2-oxoglutarate dehydrogenase complex dihydrolipoamide dehydrogenase (E3) component